MLGWGRGRASGVWAACAFLAACGGQRADSPEGKGQSGRGAVRVTAVTLGDAVDLQKAVVRPLEVFRPADTIYASVVTEGTSEDTELSARWSRGGTLLAETAQRIAPRGSATSEFHVSKPGGLEPGQYTVTIAVEGVPAAERRFTVR